MAKDNGAEFILQDCQKQLDRARRGGNWFSRGGDSPHHGTYHAQLAPYHDRVYYEGRVAWAALVMANPRLYLLGAHAPKGGPLIDTKTYDCDGAAGSWYCKGSYEPLPRGTYTFRVVFASSAPTNPGGLELTVNW